MNRHDDSIDRQSFLPGTLVRTEFPCYLWPEKGVPNGFFPDDAFSTVPTPLMKEGSTCLVLCCDSFFAKNLDDWDDTDFRKCLLLTPIGIGWTWFSGLLEL